MITHKAMGATTTLRRTPIVCRSAGLVAGIPTRVLLDVRGGMGDALMATEAAQQLHQFYPAVRITLYVRPGQGGLVRLSPWVDTLAEVERDCEVSEDGYDRVFHLHDLARRGWWKNQRHIVEMMGESLGVPLQNRPASVYIAPQVLAWAQRFWGSRPHPWIVVHPYATSQEKSWPMQHWKKLIPDLPGTVVSVGSEKQKLPCIQMEGQLDWQQTAALLSLADLQIGNDSGPMHLAAAVGCRVVAIWGATSPVNSGVAIPGRVLNLIPQRKACGRWGIPCHSPCDLSDNDSRFCMAQITPERVASSVKELLEPPERPEVSFILVVWNAGAITARMLDQIRFTATSGYDVVLVDNGSRRNEWRQVMAAVKRMQRCTQVTIVRNGTNLGYPTAANIGLRTAQGTILWLLNSDLEIGEAGWDRRVLDFFQAHRNVGIVSATSNIGAYRFGTKPVLDKPAAGDHVNGCSFAVRRECWWQVGDFDEGFSPGLLEETDLCLRAWRAGWESWHLPVAVEHQHHRVVEANIGKWPEALRQHNREYFTRKWAGATADLSGLPIVSPI